MIRVGGNLVTSPRGKSVKLFVSGPGAKRERKWRHLVHLWKARVLTLSPSIDQVRVLGRRCDGQDRNLNDDRLRLLRADLSNAIGKDTLPVDGSELWWLEEKSRMS